jgi:Domain of unknown function (DUF4411)
VVIYSFDTSAFIQGRRDVLPAETFTTFWANLATLIRRGEIRAVDVVKDELAVRDDETKKWAVAQPGLFVPLSREVQLATRKVLALHPKLMGVGNQRNGADPFVIGLAVALGGTVVTEERQLGSPSRPRIPHVCEAMEVPHTNLVGLAQSFGRDFVEKPLLLRPEH